MSQRDLQLKLGWKSHLKIHRAETGERPLTPDDLSDLLVALDAPLELGTKLVAMTHDAENDNPWLGYGPQELQRQIDALLELESGATDITTVASLLMPGLLQTPDYTRRIMAQAGVPAGEIARRVAERQGRRPATIFRREPVNLTAFIDQSVFYRSLGDRAMLAEQLDLLQDLDKLDNVEIRAIPFDAGWSTALETPFSMIKAADGSTVVHREDRLAAVFFHEPSQVHAYETALPKVAEVAMSPAATAELIAEVRNELEQE